MKKNIALVGFMATGKTEVGRDLAAKMSMKYVSVDEEIEFREKRSIKEIFGLEGEPYFRNLEKEVIKALGVDQGQIIDCGGGAVMDEENLNNLKASGSVFCLWADPEEILKRVGTCSKRPLLNVDDPMKKIKELLEERRSCYLKADFHIDTTKKRPGEISDAIRRMVDDSGE